jgi:hypothetical protein
MNEGARIGIRMVGLGGGGLAIAGLCLCEVGMALLALRAGKLSRRLGGDPPRYVHAPLLGYPGAEFWRYVRSQSERVGYPDLAVLARLAEGLRRLRAGCMLAIATVTLLLIVAR